MPVPHPLHPSPTCRHQPAQCLRRGSSTTCGNPDQPPPADDDDDCPSLGSQFENAILATVGALTTLLRRRLQAAGGAVNGEALPLWAGERPGREVVVLEGLAVVDIAWLAGGGSGDSDAPGSEGRVGLARLSSLNGLDFCGYGIEADGPSHFLPLPAGLQEESLQRIMAVIRGGAGGGRNLTPGDPAADRGRSSSPPWWSSHVPRGILSPWPAASADPAHLQTVHKALTRLHPRRRHVRADAAAGRDVATLVENDAGEEGGGLLRRPHASAATPVPRGGSSSSSSNGMYGDVGGMSSGASSGGSDGSSSGEESENESLWQAPPLSTGALAPASASLPRSIALPSPTRYSRALRPMYLLSSAAPVPAGALKRRLLAAGGWRVVSVPLMEWRALPLPQQHQPRGGALDHSRVPARSRYTGDAGSSGSREVIRAAETLGCGREGWSRECRGGHSG